MNLQKLINKASASLAKNSPVIMSGVAIAGVVSTAYLTGKASITAYQHVTLHEGINGTPEDPKDRWKGRIKVAWRHYIPSAASGAITIGCIVGSNRVSSRRGAAAQAALVLAERTYDQYRSKVIEEIGERKDQAIRDQIAEEKVRTDGPSPTIISGPGNVLCCELMTMRYFTSDMETLRRRVNDLNAYLLRHDRASLEDWYDMIGLQKTSYSADMGWHSDRQMELEFTTVLTDDGRPCLAFDYNYHRPIYGGFYS